MYKGSKILAVVPARGGSKSIYKKNIALVNGKELIVFTLDAAKGSKYIDEIVVSTDDEDIARVASREGIRVLPRPAELAQDTSKTIDVLIHVIETLADEGYDYLVLLQPTQPLKLPEHIDSAIEELIDNNFSSLVSVFPADDHPLLLRTMDEDKRLAPLLKTSSTVRRQDFKKYYVVNGTIYINRIKDMTLDTSLNDNEYGFEMAPEFNLDIDEPSDLKKFESILKRDALARAGQLDENEKWVLSL